MPQQQEPVPGGQTDSPIADVTAVPGDSKSGEEEQSETDEPAHAGDQISEENDKDGVQMQGDDPGAAGDSSKDEDDDKAVTVVTGKPPVIKSAGPAGGPGGRLPSMPPSADEIRRKIEALPKNVDRTALRGLPDRVKQQVHLAFTSFGGE
jgi:hypothetical protein